MQSVLGEVLTAPAPWWVLLVLVIVLPLVRAVALWWRERSALKLAPRVYRAGGDAAEVLRALRNSRDGSRGV